MLAWVTQNQLESINSRLWERAPKHKFHGSKRIRIAACNTVVYYNKGATGKFGLISALNLPVFQSSKELAMQKDEDRFKWLEEKSQKVDQRRKRKIEEAVEVEKQIKAHGKAYEAGKF